MFCEAITRLLKGGMEDTPGAYPKRRQVFAVSISKGRMPVKCSPKDSFVSISSKVSRVGVCFVFPTKKNVTGEVLCSWIG